MPNATRATTTTSTTTKITKSMKQLLTTSDKRPKNANCMWAHWQGLCWWRGRWRGYMDSREWVGMGRHAMHILIGNQPNARRDPFEIADNVARVGAGEGREERIHMHI